jgi:hypothetical protein
MSKSDPYAAASRKFPSKKADEPTVETAPDVVEENENENVPTGSISEIKEWIGTDKDRAQHALDVEKAKDNPRVTLVEYLEDMLSE